MRPDARYLTQQADAAGFHKIRAGVTTEYALGFLQGMVNAMSVSFHKYGKVADADGIDRLASLRTRLERYEADGNTEWLIDAANFAMMEFMYPLREGAHYEATGDGKSPGRTRVDGRSAGEGHNLDQPQPKGKP